jgi:hypothetical protein
VEVVEHRRDRHDGVLVVEDRLDDARAGQADRVVGRALALDDLVRGIPHVDGDLVELLDRELRLAVERLPVEDRDVADRRVRPQRELGVAVLADDVGVHAGDRDARALRDLPAQARGVEHRAGREDRSRAGR